MESKIENRAASGLTAEQFLESGEIMYGHYEYWVSSFEETWPNAQNRGHHLLGQIHGHLMAFHTVMRRMNLNGDQFRRYQALIQKYDEVYTSFERRVENLN